MSDMLGRMGTVKFEGPVLQVLVVTVAAIFLGGWWLIEKVVYREMDQRDDVIAKIEKSTFDNGEKIDELSAALANSIAELQAAVISELKEKHGNQEIQLVELKANYRSLSENVTRANSSTDKTIQEIKLEAKEARQKVDESLGVIREAEAVSSRLEQQENKLDSLDKALEKADSKVNLIQKMLDIGISHTALQQGILSVIGGQKEHDGEVLDLDLLLEKKKDLNPLLLVRYLTEEYAADPKDAMIVAFDALTEQRTLEFFLDLDDLPPDLAAAHGSNPDASEVVEKVMSQPRSIVDVCAGMQTVPAIGCYEYFLKWASSEEKKHEGTTGAEITNAAVRAIEDKFADKINEEIAIQTD